MKPDTQVEITQIARFLPAANLLISVSVCFTGRKTFYYGGYGIYSYNCQRTEFYVTSNQENDRYVFCPNHHCFISLVSASVK